MKYWRDIAYVAGTICVVAAVAYVHPMAAVLLVGLGLIAGAAVAGGTDGSQ